MLTEIHPRTLCPVLLHALKRRHTPCGFIRAIPAFTPRIMSSIALVPARNVLDFSSSLPDLCPPLLSSLPPPANTRLLVASVAVTGKNSLAKTAKIGNRFSITFHHPPATILSPEVCPTSGAPGSSLNLTTSALAILTYILRPLFDRKGPLWAFPRPPSRYLKGCYRHSSR